MKKWALFFCFSLCVNIFYAEMAMVSNIQAIAGRGTHITVFWTLPSEPDEIIKGYEIYRDTKPITSIQNKKPVAKVEAHLSAWTDTVKDFNDYFYAVIAICDKPKTMIMLSVNSTIEGTHLETGKKRKTPDPIIPEKKYPEGSIREMPLPYLDIIDTKDEELSENIISQETLNLAMELSKPKTYTKEVLSQYIFEEDLISPEAGDDYLLFEILRDCFVQRKYEEAIKRLEKLTGTNIQKETRHRAYFYLGEAQYLRGDYRNAIRTFVRVENQYPDLTKKWVDSALDQL